MNRLALIGALACLATPAFAAQTPKCGKDAAVPTLDPRICTLEYRKGDTYTIPLTFLGMTTLMFNEDEDVAETGGAAHPDPEGFSVVPTKIEGRLMVKVNKKDRIGRTVNVVVVGWDKRFEEYREYDIFLEARPETFDMKSGISRIIFVYPGDKERREAADRRKLAGERQARRAAKREAALRERPGDILNVAHTYGPRNHKYTRRARTPADEALLEGFRISDNGMITSFEWPPGLDGAAIFSVDADGTERMVMRAPRDGGTTIVPKVAKQWRLRRGNLLVCLENKNPTNYNPGTHTIDPRVTLRPRLRTASTTE